VVLLRVRISAGAAPTSSEAADSPGVAALGEALTSSRWEDGHFLSAVSIQTSPTELSDILQHLADLHLGVRRAALSGIPMSSKRKRSAAEDKELYQVELKCRPAPLLLPTYRENVGGLDTNREFQWLMVPQPLQGYWSKQPCNAIWQVCLSCPGAGPSHSLLSHLNAGKPVYMAPAASLAAQQGIPSHVLLRRGAGLYLHRLHSINPESVPRDMMVDVEEGSSEVRVEKFCDVLLDCVTGSLPELASLAAADNPAACSPTGGRGETDLVTCKGKPFCVPSCRRLERMTRFMPLKVKDTVAESTPALAPALRPFFEALQAPEIDPAACQMLKPLLQALESNTRCNDGVLLHNGVLDPAARRRLYTQAWAELERAAAALGDISAEHRDLMNAINIHKPKPEVPPQLPKAAQQPSASAGASPPTSPPGRPDDPERPGSRNLPLHLGPSLTILSLGRVVPDRPGFHSQAYIWPVGFRSQRLYASYMNPHARVLYLNEILNGGGAPEFRITAEDDPQHPITGNSSSGVWAQVVRRVAALKGPMDGEPPPTGKQLSHVSGPEQFGFAHPVVAKMIQELPGASRIKRASAGTPAAPHPAVGAAMGVQLTQQQLSAAGGSAPSRDISEGSVGGYRAVAGGWAKPLQQGAFGFGGIGSGSAPIPEARPSDAKPTPEAVPTLRRPAPPPRPTLPPEERAEAAKRVLLGRRRQELCGRGSAAVQQQLQQAPRHAGFTKLPQSSLEGSLLLHYWTGRMKWPAPEWAVQPSKAQKKGGCTSAAAGEGQAPQSLGATPAGATLASRA